MYRRNLIILAVLSVIAAAFYFFQEGAPSPGSLAARALSAATREDRLEAVSGLSLLVGGGESRQACAQLKRIAAESKDPEVQVRAVSILATGGSFDALPTFYAAMDDADLTLRKVGLSGALKFFGGALPDNVKYSVDAPAADRQTARRQLEQIYNEGKNPDPAKKKGAAPAPSPLAEASPAKNATGSKSEASTPSPAPEPGSVGATPMPMPGSEDYAAVFLLVWMCRVLAVLVLVGELAGALSLILGERRTAASLALEKKMMNHSKHTRVEHKPPLTVAEEVDRILARNSAGLWSKIAILVAGAMSVVALLGAAEMFQIAVRMDQSVNRVDQNVTSMSSRLR